MIAWVLFFLILAILGAIILAVRVGRKFARERRLDANTMYMAERVAECGHKSTHMGGRCIKLKGHVENGDTQHMYYTQEDESSLPPN